MTRFLHTSDWQLGMTRHYLDAESQSRFSEARFEVIERMAELAKEQECEFAVVAGDVFETNQVDRKTVVRACNAMAAFACPLYLLPGNHDCLDPATVYDRRDFVNACPPQVQVLRDLSPHSAAPKVEVVGVPWRSKEPHSDLVRAALQELPPPEGLRVMVAHGRFDELVGAHDDPASIDLPFVERKIADGDLHYLALGDRHSLTTVGTSGAICYSSAPEATAYREDAPGYALIVDIDDDGQVKVNPIQVGRWHFHIVELHLRPSEGLGSLREALAEIDDKRRAIVKLKLRGSVSLRQWAECEELLDAQRDLFAALEFPARHSDVAILPADGDFSDLGLRGWAAQGLSELQTLAQDEGEQGRAARDALGLLLRLTGGTAARGGQP